VLVHIFCCIHLGARFTVPVSGWVPYMVRYMVPTSIHHNITIVIIHGSYIIMINDTVLIITAHNVRIRICYYNNIIYYYWAVASGTISLFRALENGVIKTNLFVDEPSSARDPSDASKFACQASIWTEPSPKAKPKLYNIMPRSVTNSDHGVGKS